MADQNGIHDDGHNNNDDGDQQRLEAKLKQAMEEINKMNGENEETQAMLEDSQEELETLAIELGKAHQLNKDLDSSVRDMEHIILSLRDLVQDNDSDGHSHKAEITELQNELELTQQQVLELASIVESQAEGKMDRPVDKNKHTDFSSFQLKKKLMTTERAFLQAKEKIASEQSKVAALKLQVQTQDTHLKEKEKDFDAWKTDTAEKQILREHLSAEQDKLISSLEDHVESKKNDLALLAKEKESAHSSDLSAMDDLKNEIIALNDSHDKAIFELEEKHATEIGDKEDEIKEHEFKFAAAKERYDTSVRTLTDNQEAQLAGLTGVHQAEITALQVEINQLNSDHAEALENWKEQKKLDFAGKNKEILRLKEVEDDLYDTQIEMSILEAKYQKLETEWDARHKWRKDHEHAPVAPLKPPGAPKAFGKMDDDVAVPDESKTDIKKFTFSAAPMSLGVVVSPRKTPNPRKQPLTAIDKPNSNIATTPKRQHPLAQTTTPINRKVQFGKAAFKN